MKKLLFVSLIFIVSTGIAQQKPADSLRLAIVKDWNRISYQVNEDFWSSARPDIVRQIGEKEFEKIQKLSAQKLPNAFRMWDQNRAHKKVPMEEYFKRLASLKVYKYITFNRTNPKGEVVKHWILKVPFQELYWDKTTKWDTVYILIKADAVEG